MTALFIFLAEKIQPLHLQGKFERHQSERSLEKRGTKIRSEQESRSAARWRGSTVNVSKKVRVSKM